MPCRRRQEVPRRVPDEAGGVRAIVLGIAHSHSGRDGSGAMTAAKEMLMQRGSTPRVYRIVLVFLAAETRQLDNLKEAMRNALAWDGIVRETERLNLTQSDSLGARDRTGTQLRGSLRAGRPVPHGNRKRTGSQLPCIPKGPRRYNSHRQ